MVDLSQSHELVKQIYHEAYATPVKDFKKVCFELLGEEFGIDSGTWITRCERVPLFYEQEAYTYQLPPGFMEDYHHLASVSTQVQQVFGYMMGNLGRTLDILDVVPADEWFGSDMYKLYCEKFNLHHSLMTVTTNPANHALNVITFARHHPDRGFTQEEKNCKEFVVPNLIEAMRVNILNSFHKGGKEQANRAVFDCYGRLIEAEEGFLTLSLQFKLLDDGKLSFDISSDSGHYEADEYELDYQNHNGLVFVELQTSPLLNKLSGKQKEVCKYLIEGQSNKEIARVMSLSPNTVNNHLKEVYKLLNVNNRQQAAAYLIRQVF